jgi:hypothetical protein
MSHPVLTLELPEDVYERVRRAAKGMNQPVEKALVDIVRAATPSLENRPSTGRNSRAWRNSAMMNCGGSRAVASRLSSSAGYNGYSIRISEES